MPFSCTPSSMSFTCSGMTETLANSRPAAPPPPPVAPPFRELRGRRGGGAAPQGLRAAHGVAVDGVREVQVLDLLLLHFEEALDELPVLRLQGGHPRLEGLLRPEALLEFPASGLPRRSLRRRRPLGPPLGGFGLRPGLLGRPHALGQPLRLLPRPARLHCLGGQLLRHARGLLVAL